MLLPTVRFAPILQNAQKPSRAARVGVDKLGQLQQRIFAKIAKLDQVINAHTGETHRLSGTSAQRQEYLDMLEHIEDRRSDAEDKMNINE